MKKIIVVILISFLYFGCGDGKKKELKNADGSYVILLQYVGVSDKYFIPLIITNYQISNDALFKKIKINKNELFNAKIFYTNKIDSKLLVNNIISLSEKELNDNYNIVVKLSLLTGNEIISKSLNRSQIKIVGDYMNKTFKNIIPDLSDELKALQKLIDSTENL